MDSHQFSLHLSEENILHGVEAGGAGDDPLGGAEGASGEDVSGLGGVGEGDGFAESAEVGFVATDGVADAQGVDADLAGGFVSM